LETLPKVIFQGKKIEVILYILTVVFLNTFDHRPLNQMITGFFIMNMFSMHDN